ncbi:P-loop NTPase [Rhodoluna sp.]|uniref:P-loop NTPase n=1 Tax=Rhodoluna sp. TaxID=1969481 RepID=UPI0025EE662F|nr:P-loop NTPase [Rhodoluna sp.]
MTASEIKQALAKVIDPELRLPITDLDMVDVVDNQVTIKLTVVGCPAADRIEADVRKALEDFDATVTMSVMTQAERDALKEKLRDGRPPRQNPFDKDTLTRIYLVGSGKGGVGKSSVTANLAVALAEKGFRVGLVDADIFGFSIPGQLGITAKPTQVDEMILPPVAFGVKVISIGMFLDDNKPVAWRGPMLHRAVQQFLTDVYWGDLDFLLVDLPPGTGDVAISLGQLLPTAKSIVVTTPQVAAAEVAERSGSVGLQTGQSVFGVIENMAWLVQPDGSKFELFGAGGGSAVAARLSALSNTAVPVLGQVPISIALREGSDAGAPVVITNPNDPAAAAIIQVAEKISSDKIGLAGKKLRVSL